MSRSSELQEIAAALSGFQSEIEAVKKDKEGYGYNYSDLSAVIAYAKPVLAKWKLSVSQLLGSDAAGNMTVQTILMHASGQYISSEVSLPQLQLKSMNSCQAAGASISYFRRYAYQAILGMSSEDNDASTGAGTPAPTYQQPNQYNTQGMP